MLIIFSALTNWNLITGKFIEHLKVFNWKCYILYVKVYGCGREANGKTYDGRDF